MNSSVKRVCLFCFVPRSRCFKTETYVWSQCRFASEFVEVFYLCRYVEANIYAIGSVGFIRLFCRTVGKSKVDNERRVHDLTLFEILYYFAVKIYDKNKDDLKQQI